MNVANPLHIKKAGSSRENSLAFKPDYLAVHDRFGEEHPVDVGGPPFFIQVMLVSAITLDIFRNNLSLRVSHKPSPEKIKGSP
ncbi:MAG: hypothetical protein NTV99_00690 [Deltaproteobacteria bacterium]|nr:hypothetical protein [Deltaproteobacteria bacterium]